MANSGRNTSERDGRGERRNLEIYLVPGPSINKHEGQGLVNFMNSDAPMSSHSTQKDAEVSNYRYCAHRKRLKNNVLRRPTPRLRKQSFPEPMIMRTGYTSMRLNPSSILAARATQRRISGPAMHESAWRGLRKSRPLSPKRRLQMMRRLVQIY